MRVIRSCPTGRDRIRTLGHVELVRQFLKGNTDRRQDMLQGAFRTEQISSTRIARQTVTLRELRARGAECWEIYAGYSMPDLDVRASSASLSREIPVLKGAQARAIEVVWLDNILVADPTGGLRCEDGRWIIDLHPSLGSRFVKSFPKLQCQAEKPSRKLKGTSVLLASPSSRNYYHWLHQTLAKIDAIQDAVADARIDRWLVHDLSAFSRDILARLGIDLRKVQEVGPDPILCDRLVVCTAPTMGALHYSGSWPYRRIRDLYLDSEGIKPWRKLYFKRAQDERRAIVNADRVEATLADQGFEIVSMEKLTLSEQARISAEASVIVSPHGAALANLVFCTPGTKVVELLPRLWPSPLYGMIAQSCGLDHFFVPGSEPCISSLRIRRDSAATKVSIDRLVGALDA